MRDTGSASKDALRGVLPLNYVVLGAIGESNEISEDGSHVATKVIFFIDYFMETTTYGIAAKSPSSHGGSKVDKTAQCGALLLKVVKPSLDTSHRRHFLTNKVRFLLGRP